MSFIHFPWYTHTYPGFVKSKYKIEKKNKCIYKVNLYNKYVFVFFCFWKSYLLGLQNCRVGTKYANEYHPWGVYTMTEIPGTVCNNGNSLNLQGAARKREHTKRQKKGGKNLNQHFYLLNISGGAEWMWRENISTDLWQPSSACVSANEQQSPQQIVLETRWRKNEEKKNDKTKQKNWQRDQTHMQPFKS